MHLLVWWHATIMQWWHLPGTLLISCTLPFHCTYSSMKTNQDSLLDLGLVILSQPDLSHRDFVRTKWKGELTEGDKWLSPNPIGDGPCPYPEGQILGSYILFMSILFGLLLIMWHTERTYSLWKASQQCFHVEAALKKIVGTGVYKQSPNRDTWSSLQICLWKVPIYVCHLLMWAPFSSAVPRGWWWYPWAEVLSIRIMCDSKTRLDLLLASQSDGLLGRWENLFYSK